GGEKAGWSRRQRMKYDLLHLKAKNKAFVPLTSDSIAKDLVDYYDTWGNANERMTAYYLLGCVYRDKGDSPQAIDAYLDAVAQADTTSKDCDFRTISRIYAQMAGEYHKQLLLSYEIDASKQASHYALLAKDTLTAIFEKEICAGIYILLNKKDSAENILKETMCQYKQYGYTKNAIQSSTKLMYMYVQEASKLPEAKHLIDEYEAKSDRFSSDHELKGANRIFYYYKGQYFDGINQLDSAEYYYRKICHHNMPFTAYNSMYKGLLSVYTKRHQADSIAKYARLYCEANDSSIAKKDKELTAQMAASYNYNLHQKDAMESKAKVYRTRLALITMLALIIIAGIITWNRVQKIRKRKQQEIIDLNTKYQNATNEYNNNLHTLQLLDNAHQKIIAAIQEELDKTRHESEAYRSKLFEINAEYDDTKAKLSEENRRLTETLKALERRKGIPRYLENTESFMDTDIVKHLKQLETIPLSKVTEDNWAKLINEVSTYFPQLLNDLNNLPKMTKQKVCICLLVAIRIQDSCIANWLNQKAPRISNIKSELNQELFGDRSARTLFNNLSKKYNIMTIGK
ncbi:MAG: hypothetical protein J5965_04730, partial [Aeriscardovia sp.]|nr:hypothetical protein [Aeriscardovia sp.]